jgi:hypothetical protein
MASTFNFDNQSVDRIERKLSETGVNESPSLRLRPGDDAAPVIAHL